MEYRMEELLPIVSKLVERFTAYESTSVTYETAQQLMGAVIYSINELNDSQTEMLAKSQLSPEEAYRSGKQRLTEKGKAALELYQKILEMDTGYGSLFLTSTVKEMAVFFRKYDEMFCPQEDIISFDYPLLTPFHRLSGIDKVFVFLKTLQMEIAFLNTFRKEEVLKRLNAISDEYMDNQVNLCELFVHSLFQEFLSVSNLTIETLSSEALAQIKPLFLQAIVKDSMDTPQLREYLMIAVKNIPDIPKI